MFKLFVEYKIDPGHREAYLQWLHRQITDKDNCSIYEGTDQPNLFVEMWEASSEQAAQAIKKERCSERSEWRKMALWVPGGAEKIHAWVFKAL